MGIIQFAPTGLWSILLLLLISVQAPENNNSFLIGSIVNEEIEPITNSIILARNTESQQLFQTVVDVEGIFTFEKLPEGTYQISIEAENYQTSQFKLVLVSGATIQMNFTLKRRPVNQPKVNQSEPAAITHNDEKPAVPAIGYGVITGQVLDELQLNIDPFVISAKEINSKKTWQTSLTETGAFCLDGLPEGEYEIYVNRRGSNTKSVQLTLSAGCIVIIKMRIKN